MPAPSAPIAIVTAGSKRLGRQIVLRLAQLGYDIGLHCNRSTGDAQQTAEDIRALGRRCEIVQANFLNSAEVLSVIPAVIDRLGAPSLLINNASSFRRNTLLTCTPEQFDEDFSVHVRAPLFLTRDFAKSCRQGQIINIVDAAVGRNASGYFTYLLSKKSLKEVTRMAAVELAPGIRVNAIAPGIILPAVGWTAEESARTAAENILQRQASPADILLAMEYLLKSPQVTGDCLFVDGGDHVEL